MDRWGIDVGRNAAPPASGGPGGSPAGKPPPYWPLRAGLTAALLGFVLLRIVRVCLHLESVAEWYSGGTGAVWGLIKMVMFLGPFAVTLAAALAPWFRNHAADALWAAGFFGGGFFTLSEGLILFARSMDGRHAYVGAEPLLSLAVCVSSGIALLARLLGNGRRT